MPSNPRNYPMQALHADDKSIKSDGHSRSLDLHVILFAAMSPLCAVCGFMLAEIAGFAPF